MQAIIFKPTKTSMQSGKAKTQAWVLKFEPDNSRSIEGLMGWTSSQDMKQELNLSFESLEQAKEFATKHNIDYEIIESTKHNIIKRSYSQNFN